MDYSLELKLHQSTHDLLGEKNNKIYDENINITKFTDYEPFNVNYNENNKNNNYVLIYLLFFLLLIFFFYKN